MTKKYNVAIFVDTKKKSGGAFHEQIYFIKNLEKFNKNNDFEFKIICSSKNIILQNQVRSFEFLYFNLTPFWRYVLYLRNHHHFFRRIKKYFLKNNKFETFLKKNEIDFVIFTGPSQYPLYLEKTNFSIIVPDVAHRENFEHPELSYINSEFDRKEEIFSKCLIKASFIITNSNIIKDRISFFYSVLKERIIIMNQQPSLAVQNFKIDNADLDNFKKEFNLPKKYIFYPSMYHTHKNHRILIDGLKILKKLNKDFHLVFCGDDKGCLKNLKNYSKALGLEKNIRFLNFVKDEDLPLLYLNSLGLANPSLIGPTNIPPWEAFKLKIPVLYPDFGGIRSVLGEAVHYFDPYDPQTFAEGVLKIEEDQNYRNNLISKGAQLFNSIDVKKDFDEIFNHLRKVKLIEKTWKF